MPRPQYTLRALLVLMLAVACFFGGIRFGERRERDRRTRQDAADMNEALAGMAKLHADLQARINEARRENPWADLLGDLPARERARGADETIRQTLKEVAD